MNNLGSHKGAGVRAAIEAAGASLLYLRQAGGAHQRLKGAALMPLTRGQVQGKRDASGGCEQVELRAVATARAAEAMVLRLAHRA